MARRTGPSDGAQDATAPGLSRLSSETGGSVYRFAYLLTGEQAAAEEVAADALAAVTRAEPGAALPRLLAAVQRCAQPYAAVGAESERRAASGRAGGPGERREALLGAVRRLPAAEQRVLFLRLLEGWSSGETASALGRERGEVRALSLRALAQLRRALDA